MIKHSKVWLALVAATAIFGALVGTASARSLSTSSQTIRAVWNPMNFASPSAGVTVRCQVTLEGSLHSRTIGKVVGSLVGYITRATVNACTGGTARVRTETLPWHVQYAGFTGTLPAITSIRTTVVRPAFDITATFFEFINITCTYRTTNVSGTFTRETGGGLTRASVEGRSLAPDQGFPCETGELSGETVTTNGLTVLNATTRITVTLI
jgi:hypothetical protein